MAGPPHQAKESPKPQMSLQRPYLQKKKKRRKKLGKRPRRDPLEKKELQKGKADLLMTLVGQFER